MSLALPGVLRQRGGAFSPSDISGLALWLDATDNSTISFSSGSNVSQWNDKSGGGRNATASQTPALMDGVINGRQGINLSGSSFFTGAMTNTGTTMTLFVVATQSSGTPASSGIFCLGRPGFPDWNDSGSLNIANNNGTALTAIGRAPNGKNFNPTFAVPFLVSAVFDGATFNAFFNGTIISPTNQAATQNFAYTTYAVGNRAGSTGSIIMRGQVGEIIVYSPSSTYNNTETTSRGLLGEQMGGVISYSAIVDVVGTSWSCEPTRWGCSVSAYKLNRSFIVA